MTIFEIIGIRSPFPSYLSGWMFAPVALALGGPKITQVVPPQPQAKNTPAPPPTPPAPSTATVSTRSLLTDWVAQRSRISTVLTRPREKLIPGSSDYFVPDNRISFAPPSVPGLITPPDTGGYTPPVPPISGGSQGTGSTDDNPAQPWGSGIIPGAQDTDVGPGGSVFGPGGLIDQFNNQDPVSPTFGSGGYSGGGMIGPSGQSPWVVTNWWDDIYSDANLY